MCRNPDKQDRNKALIKNFKILQDTFPNWKKNEYLKKQKSKNGIFMRSVNAFTYKLYSKIFPVMYRVK